MNELLKLIDRKWDLGNNEFTAYSNNPETFNRKVITQGDFTVFLNSLSFDELRKFCEHFNFPNDYKLAADFMLDKFGVSFKTKFLTYDLHFEDDKEKRNIYSVIFERKDRKALIIPEFGQSIANSSEYIGPRNTYFKDLKEVLRRGYSQFNKAIKKNPNFGPPTAYDILACLQKYEVGKFSDFCAEFGYDEDSRKAYKTYEAVRDEWLDVSRFFTRKELEQLREIA